MAQFNSTSRTRITTKQLLRTSSISHAPSKHTISTHELNDCTPIKQVSPHNQHESNIPQLISTPSQSSHVRSVSQLIESAVLQQHSKHNISTVQPSVIPMHGLHDEIVINYAAPVAPPIYIVSTVAVVPVTAKVTATSIIQSVEIPVAPVMNDIHISNPQNIIPLALTHN